MAKTLFDLSGRVALVTGGSKGLGKSMARGFLEAGADVMISSRHESELRETVEELGAAASPRIEWVVADMVERTQVDALAATTLDRMGQVDILVNNAGGNTPQSLEDVVDEDWDRIVELNLTSCMLLTRVLVPQMKERRWGRVIHISSVLGFGGREGRSAYCSTKSALLGLTRASALEL